MKFANYAMHLKKKFAVILHLIFLILLLIGVSLLFTNVNFGRGLTWLKTEKFEDSDIFNGQLQSDIEHIFDYVNFKDVFETNGEIDFNKQMVSVSYRSTPTYNEEKDTVYTLDELIRYAKTKGYYLNDQYKVVKGPASDEETEASDILVNWKAYRPTERYREPGDAFASMEELSLEILTYLGDYYTTRSNLVESPTNLYFTVCYQRQEGDISLYTNSGDKSIDELKALGRYSYLTGSSIIMETNLSTPPKNMTTTLEACNPYQNNNYYMIVAIDTSYSAPDIYAGQNHIFHLMRLLHVMGMISMATGVVGCFVTLLYLVKVSGFKTNHSQDITLHYSDTISSETSIFITVLIALFAIFVSNKVGGRILHVVLKKDYWAFAEQLLRTVVIYGVCVLEVFSLIRRYKAGTLWSNSMISSIKRDIALCLTRRKFTFRLSVCFMVYLICDVVMLASSCYILLTWDGISRFIIAGSLFAVFLVFNLWIFLQLFRNAWENDKINEAVCNIAAGDTSYKIDTADFSGKEKSLADSINNISIGLETALKQQVKSERLKADLITNVSHDIKTPLTSIINYVDLIKRENIQDEKILGYLDVLEQKSQRLKNLTEDLVEASKASSGNLKLEINNIDFVELVHQTNGEFKEKFSIRHLELVTLLPETGIIIEADGRRLWRVLENLYNNAFKYAMEASRIYIDVTAKGELVVFTIKNVSANPLNIKANELTERFVRGDVARTTEGSGLGLSIAKSLTELQHGLFEIYIDGDLFKVKVSFPIKK